MEAQGTAPRPDRRLARLVPWAVLALLLALSAKTRIDAAFRDPNFDVERPDGLLKSDPALLYYITEQIVESGGLPPADLRADPRVQHPDLTDLLAEFAVGQEFLVAWCYRLFAPDEPLHVVCVRVMSLTATLAGLAVFLLVWARSRQMTWALVATALFCMLPANYRTIGFILVREDLSFPLFALHLALLSWAVEKASPRVFLFSGLALGGALATWHAMGFFAAIEVALLHLWFLWGGKSPFEIEGAWAVLVGPVLAATVVPALSASGFLLGPAMQLGLALLAVALIRVRRPLRRLPSVMVAGGVWLLLALLARALSPARSGYSHVYDLLSAKLSHLGELPDDPNTISFDARLLWQGPFETLSPTALADYLGWPALTLIGVAAIVLLIRRRRAHGFDAWLLAFLLASLPIAWLIERTVILTGLLAPAVAACILARHARPRLWLGLYGAGLLLQAPSFFAWVQGYACPWYLPPVRQAEIRALVSWVDANLDPNEAVLGDFMNSTAILAHSKNPICLQPKYETEESRRKAELFLKTFFFGTTEDLHALAQERFRAEYVLVDRYTLGELSAYTAGVRGPPGPGTAAAIFLNPEQVVFGNVPGFELVYQSPPDLPRLPGEPEGFFRLYRVL